MLVNYVLLHYQVTTTSLIKQSSPRRCIFQLYNKMYNNKKRKNVTIILKRQVPDVNTFTCAQWTGSCEDSFLPTKEKLDRNDKNRNTQGMFK